MHPLGEKTGLGILISSELYQCPWLGVLRFFWFDLEFFSLKIHPLPLILLPFFLFSSFNVMLEVFRVKIKSFKMGFQLKKKNSHLSFYTFGVENLGVKAAASHISVLLTYLIIHCRSEEVSSG